MSQTNTIDLDKQYDVSGDLYAEVIHGLNQQPRSVPPKFFYDEVGSRLFEAICETEEYYPTRTEMAILQENLDEIVAHIGPDCVLVEPGCGSIQKVRQLIEAAKPHTYVPMDISGDYLQEVAEQLVADYPEVKVHPAVIDYTKPIILPNTPKAARKIAFFPGSSIGNFTPEDAIDFLTNIAVMVGQGGGLLIGVDLKKEPAILSAAYNDAAGVTAQFNLNLLTRINTDLGANFDLENFNHHAFYNEHEGRVEMHLVSDADQQVHINGEKFDIAEGESIHTENSYKYTIKEFHGLARQAGFTPSTVWTDTDELFSIHFLENIE